jgi:hypothetical protein
MKRASVALGILGLVCAVSLPATHAATLLQDDFSTDKLLKDPLTYVQGFGTSQVNNDATTPPFYIHDGYLSSISPDMSILSSDGTGADEVAALAPTDPPHYPFVLLTGDPKWADVAIQMKIYSYDQNTGRLALILRATPKTKPTDPDSWYEFAYLTSGGTAGDVTGTNEGLTADQVASGIQPVSATPTLRIEKVVKNKWKVLAETDYDKSKDHIPEINLAGVDHDASGGGDQSNPTGAVFRFVAKGNVLQAWAALPGKPFIKYLEVTDTDLTAGKVGITHTDYDPIFDDLLVEDAP